MQSQNNRMISVHFQGKSFNIMVFQLYAPTSEEVEVEWFYEHLQDHLQLTPSKKDVLFIIGFLSQVKVSKKLQLTLNGEMLKTPIPVTPPARPETRQKMLVIVTSIQDSTA